MKYFYKYYASLLLALGTICAYAQPDANFSVNTISGCVPLSVQFTSIVGTSSTYTHSWDFGNFNSSVLPNPATLYTSSGTFTVTHKVTGPGGTGTSTKTITVHPSPVVNFSATPLGGCPPLSVDFTNLSTPNAPGTVQYYWVFGNGATPATVSGTNAAAANPTNIIYNNPGSNNVTLEIKNSYNCVASVTKPLYINIKDKPKFSFFANKTDFCTDTGTVTFTPVISGGAPGPYTYLWEFGGPTNPTSTASSPTHFYTGTPPTTFTVKLTITAANGCSETVIRTDYIKMHKPKASFTGPATICPFETASFTNTSVISGATYDWDYGDGSPREGVINGNHKYAYQGTYTVKLFTIIGGCVDSATRTIVVRPQPNPGIVINPDSVCPAPQLVCFNTTSPMSSYNWGIENEIGVSTFTSPNPCVLFGKNGCWTALLRVADVYGCKDTVLRTFVIHELNIVTKVNDKYAPYPYYSDSGCVPFKAAFKVGIFKGDPALYPCDDTIRTYPYGMKKVKWKFDNGDTSIAFYPVYTYADSGQFTVTVEVETYNGCIIRDTIRVKAGYKPIIDSIDISDTVICPKSPVHFVAHVRGYDTLLYWWDFGDFRTKTKMKDSTISHYYEGGPPCIDSHVIKLVTYHKGCKSDTFKTNDTVNSNKRNKFRYVVLQPPCADFSWDIDTCSKPLTVRFTNWSKGDSSWLWVFGDGDTSTTRNPVHTYPVKGYYDVKLIVHNDSTNCYDTMHKRVFFGKNSPNVLANKTELCKGDSVAFRAYQTGDSSAASYTWFINGVQVAANIDAVTIPFHNPGLYTVMVQSYHPQTKCTDTITKTNWITVGGPIVGFKVTKDKVCYGDTVKFTDTSYTGSGTTISKRFWYFGSSPTDTLTTLANNLNRIYPATGDFDNKLIITDNLGCKDSVYKQMYVHVLKPIAAYSVQSPSCVGIEVSFGDASTNARSYNWTFGDGGTDTAANPLHIYTTMSTFNTRLIVTDSIGCTDTLSLPLETTKPIADFTMSDSMSVCPPLIVQFDGSVSTRQKTYTWYFDDGTSPGFKKTNTVVYNDIKEYKVKLIVTDNIGCKDSITKTVQVLGYAGAFTYNPVEGCVPLTVNFTSLVKGSIPTMIWDYGDGNTLLGSHTQLNVTYTYMTPGRYLPRMIFNNNQGCVIGSEGLDTILVDAAIADFETGPACQYSQVQFINKSSGVITPLNITNWTFHDGGFTALKDPKRNYGAPGKYKVKLYVSNIQGCKDSIEKEITINVPIEITALGDTIICLKDSAQLIPSGGVSYIWSPATTLSCADCPKPYAFPKVKTKYNVISTDVNGCHDTTDVDVDIKTHVTSIVGDGGEICDGENITLSVSGARSYLWSPAHTLDDNTKPEPVASPKENTKYMVIAYEGSCIPDTSHVDVIVHPRPTVSVRGEQTIVAGTVASLLASGDNIIRFLWSPANTLSCDNCADPEASPFKTTVYTVKVFSKFGCEDSTNVTITVMCDESQLFIPNTFTPNGDGVNDIFMVRGNGISTLQSFRIYNRWGEVMFERTNVTVNDKQYGWDGTMNGAKLPPDVYVYTVEANCENGELLKLKGDVTIIR